jgi:hypothetical protein
VDKWVTPDLKTPGKMYSCFVVYAIAFWMLGIIFMLFCSLLFWYNLANKYWKGGMWWLFILPPTAFTLMLLATACYMKRSEDQKIFQRNFALYLATREIQSRLAETNLIVAPGPYSAWIEILIRPGYGSPQSSNYSAKRQTPPRSKLQHHSLPQRLSPASRAYSHQPAIRNPKVFDPHRHLDTIPHRSFVDGRSTTKKPLNRGRYKENVLDDIRRIKEERSEVFQDMKKRQYMQRGRGVADLERGEGKSVLRSKVLNRRRMGVDRSERRERTPRLNGRTGRRSSVLDRFTDL